jgi:hypothetical protein
MRSSRTKTLANAEAERTRRTKGVVNMILGEVKKSVVGKESDGYVARRRTLERLDEMERREAEFLFFFSDTRYIGA